MLKSCHRAGLVKRGVVSIDGTRLASNASADVNLEFERITREIVAQTKATDEAEDEGLGDARADELTEGVRTLEGRREFLRHSHRDEEGERPEQIAEESDGEPEIEEPERTPTPEFEFELDAAQIVEAGGGRRAWLREAQRQLEQHRWENPGPIGRSREKRLLLAAERLEAELSAEGAGNEANED